MDALMDKDAFIQMAADEAVKIHCKDIAPDICEMVTVFHKHGLNLEEGLNLLEEIREIKERYHAE